MTQSEPAAREYEYRGMMAKAWDLLRGDYSTWPDRPFWRAVIERQGGAALDVGCGTGRLILDFLAAGLDVDGVDNSPEMLAICRAKAEAAGIDVDGRLFEQEMEELALDRRYATIFVPSLSFQLLTDLSAAARALARFRDHLAPGGVLVLSFQAKLWPGRHTPQQQEWTSWYKEAEQPRPEDGAVIRRWSRERFDHELQLVDEENRYELLRDGEVVESEFHERSPCVRWYSLAQALEIVERAGFADVRATTGDSFDPAPTGDLRFKVFGSRG
jgi:SAM-dependent methyltransferase